MGKLIPILLALVGLGAGIGAGLALRPVPDAVIADDTCECDPPAATGPVLAPKEADARGDYVKMNNQFVVPVVTRGSMTALVVLSLTLQVPTGSAEIVYQREPRLRDQFLQVLFDHANAGGFDGAFTTGPNMDRLRAALRDVAREVLGGNLFEVLITDIIRQDL